MMFLASSVFFISSVVFAADSVIVVVKRLQESSSLVLLGVLPGGSWVIMSEFDFGGVLLEVLEGGGDGSVVIIVNVDGNLLRQRS